MKKSTIYHGDQSQQMNAAEESALVDAGVVVTVGENLGHLEYVICPPYTWADVDRVLAELKQAASVKA